MKIPIIKSDEDPEANCMYITINEAGAWWSAILHYGYRYINLCSKPRSKYTPPTGTVPLDFVLKNVGIGLLSRIWINTFLSMSDRQLFSYILRKRRKKLM